MSSEFRNLPVESPTNLPAESAPADVPALQVEKKPSTVEMQQEYRDQAIGQLLANAYANASNLQLTESESKALRAKFEDHMVRGGAKGEDNLLYIQHIHLSDRLNDVLGIGQWTLVKRSQRAEQTKTRDGKPLVRIYFEGVLVIRGCFATEAVGVGHYHPNNPKEDYGSALESSMSDCLTRCCKRLGIGSQTWDKGYTDEWLRKYSRQRPPVAMPTATTAEPEDGPTAEQGGTPEGTTIVRGVIEAVKVTNGKTKKGKPFTRYGVTLDGVTYGTFDEELGELAQGAEKEGCEVAMVVEKDGKYWNVTEITLGPVPSLAQDSAGYKEDGAVTPEDELPL